MTFRDAVRERVTLPEADEGLVVASAEVFRTRVTPAALEALDRDYLGPERSAAVESLEGQSFEHAWQLLEALQGATDAWRPPVPDPANDDDDQSLEAMSEYEEMLEYVLRHLVDGDGQ